MPNYFRTMEIPLRGRDFSDRDNDGAPSVGAHAVGGELGLHVSFTGGNQWVRLHLKNLPPVAVRDIVIHPRENDLILGTHGRAIWILDDASPLQQMNAQVISESAHLFGMRPALRFDGGGRGGGGGLGSGGNKPFSGPNPGYGAPVTYYLKEKGPAKIEILDSSGKVIRDLGAVPQDAGLNRTTWDLRYQGPHVRRAESDDDGGGFRFRPIGPLVLPGKYTVRLTAGGKTLTEAHRNFYYDLFETTAAARQKTSVSAKRLTEFPPSMRAGIPVHAPCH